MLALSTISSNLCVSDFKKYLKKEWTTVHLIYVYKKKIKQQQMNKI